MDNEQTGFKKLSEVENQPTDQEGVGSGIAAGAKDMANQVSQKLKTAGIDADGAIEMVERRATDLQDMLAEEIRERPLRALGWAAAAGIILGILSAR